MAELKTDSRSSLILMLQVATVIISVISLVVSCATSQRQNRIAELQARPQVIVTDIFRRGGDTDTFQATDGSTLFRVYCRHVIRVHNAGGATTALQSIYVTVILDGNEIMFDYPINDVLGSGGEANGIFFTGYLTERHEGPIDLKERATVDIGVTIEIEADPMKYSLNPSVGTQPDSPDLSPRSDQLWVRYTLRFPDASPVTTEPAFCLYAQ